MAGLAAAAVVVSAVSVISGFLGSKKASKAAKKQAAEEARLEGIVTKERLRQIDKEERAVYGETVAGYAGGGVLSGFGSIGQTDLQPLGSAKSVLAEQAAEFGFERKVTREAGASKVQGALARGKATASAYKFAGISNAATGISSIISSYIAATK